MSEKIKLYPFIQFKTSLDNAYIKSDIGQRKSMEDCHVMAILGPNLRFYGIFDGHCGDKVSTYVAKELPLTIFTKFAEISVINQQQIIKIIQDSFLEIDYDIFNQKINGGTTAICALISPYHIFLINLGDSRGIILNHNVISFITKDHLPINHYEQQRIIESGHIVNTDSRINPKGTGRIDSTLSVSRALGDNRFKHLKGTYTGVSSPVSPFADIHVHSRKKADKIILACDGLWDVIRTKEIPHLILNKDNFTICHHLLKLAMKRKSTDNVSVMSISL